VSGWKLTLKQPPALRVDLHGVLPSGLAALDAGAIAKLPLEHGRETLALGDLFTVTPHGDDETLLLDGDCSRFDCVGSGLVGGTLRIAGDVGDSLGLQMRGGTIVVEGSARDLAACEMAGGRIEVRGDVGAFAATTLPGSMDGMRGGVLVVRGNAGDRLADRMRRGTVVVHGDAGDFMASRLVAGTLALGGGCGVHAGYGQRRGSIVFCGALPELPPTFVSTAHEIGVFWGLLARDLQREGGVFAGLAARRPQRHVGDTAVAGKGEWLFVS
jgi:formylmethanofuran dehydrogenase subunit C